MSSIQQKQLTEALTKLGLSQYQAKTYAALASLGPSDVADIQKASGVPRTKIYEVLDHLLDMGAVEFQSGRPIFYNALPPNIVVDRMRNSYLAAADDATRLIAEMQQTSKNTTEDFIWAVRGMFAIRRKLALTISSAKERVIMVEQYPPKLLLAVGANLKAQHTKGVQVRAICAVEPGQHVDERFKKEEFIEFRRMTVIADLAGVPDDTTEAFRRMVTSILEKRSSLTIVDDTEAFLYLPNLSDDSRSAGISLRIPGLPMLQRLLFERIIQQGTTRIK
ncbi:MAG TPA: helix-turn-helix domain-containing protein [Oculatellaceae cyanobacterium]